MAQQWGSSRRAITLRECSKQSIATSCNTMQTMQNMLPIVEDLLKTLAPGIL